MRAMLVSVVGALSGVAAGRPWRPPARSFVSHPGSPGLLRRRAGRLLAAARGARDRRRQDRLASRALPEVIDLLLLGVGAGLSPQATVERCRSVVPEPFAGAFEDLERRLRLGDRFATALDAVLSPLGPRARPLLAALLAAQQDSTAMATALRRVGDEARRRRRVEAQERARRLPVLLSCRWCSACCPRSQC